MVMWPVSDPLTSSSGNLAPKLCNAVTEPDSLCKMCNGSGGGLDILDTQKSVSRDDL